MPVQLGGGIRSLADVERWLERGIERVIIGTAAVRDPDFVREACRKFPGKVAVGIDAKGGKVAVEGWAKRSELTADELAARFADAGVAAIVYTDIDRDGVLAGINWDATLALAASTSIPVIASGGLASMDDIERLAQPGLRYSRRGDLRPRALRRQARPEGRTGTVARMTPENPHHSLPRREGRARREGRQFRRPRRRGRSRRSGCGL